MVLGESIRNGKSNGVLHRGIPTGRQAVVRLIRHSSYPLLLLKLLESRERQSTVSNEEINSVLSHTIGKDWEDFLYEYKRNLGKYHGMDQQNMDDPSANIQ